MEEEAQGYVTGQLHQMRQEYESHVEDYQKKAKNELEDYIKEAQTHAGDQVVRTYSAQREARTA